MARYIGGSLLPSNCARILQPIETKHGTLQVCILPEQDTHGLFAGAVLLAEHPNGYSCHEMGARIRDGGKAAEQAEYIIACGGKVTPAGWTLLTL